MNSWDESDPPPPVWVCVAAIFIGITLFVSTWALMFVLYAVALHRELEVGIFALGGIFLGLLLALLLSNAYLHSYRHEVERATLQRKNRELENERSIIYPELERLRAQVAAPKTEESTDG